MTEVRCVKCNKLLYKSFKISDGAVNFDRKVAVKSMEYSSEKVLSIESKCPRCGEINITKF